MGENIQDNLPKFLKKGDKILICATARKVEKLDLEFAIKTIEGQGFEVELSQNLFSSHNQFSGTDNQRLNDLQTALDDPSIRAIFIARGGYGTARIIDNLDYSKFIKSPKWVIGFSDITSLLMDIYEKTGICSIHGPMPMTFSWDKKSTDSIFDLLRGEKQNLNLKSENQLNLEGIAEGVLVGGNLSVLYSVSETLQKSFSKPFILFLEDLDEYLYHIDRMMLALKRANKLKNLQGLICGSFTEIKDNTIPFGLNALEIIKSYMPVSTKCMVFDFQSGHSPQNSPLIVGKKSVLMFKDFKVSFVQ